MRYNSSGGIRQMLYRIADLIKKGKYDIALKECNMDLKENPMLSIAYSFKAGIYQDLGKYDQGLKYVDLAIKYADKHLMLKCIKLKANLMCDVDRYDEGLKLADKAIELGVKPSDLDIFRGKALYNMYSMHHITGKKDISLAKKCIRMF